MSARFQSLCAIAGMVGLAIFFAGFIAADFVPPPKANWSAGRLAEFYRSDPDLKRFGIFLMLMGIVGFGTLTAGMSVALARGEQRPQILAVAQGVIGACGTTLLVLFTFLVGVAAFRPDRNPEITQSWHDAGWFMAFLSAMPFTTQAATIAAAVLTDRSPAPILPRWFGYLNISCAVLLFPGVALIMFKTGPLSYHGILGYWIPVVVFASWMVSMAWGIGRSARTPVAA